MSSLDHLPHIDQIALMTREELVHHYEPIEIEIRDIREELRNVQEARSLQLPFDLEWLKRLRFGKQLRERLLVRIRARMLELKRQELGGDPAAMVHRGFLHGLLAAVGELDKQAKEALLTRARILQASYTPSCEHCALTQRRSSHGERADRVAENVDAEHAEPPVVTRLAEAHLVPPTFPGNEDQGLRSDV